MIATNEATNNVIENPKVIGDLIFIVGDFHDMLNTLALKINSYFAIMVRNGILVCLFAIFNFFSPLHRSCQYTEEILQLPYFVRTICTKRIY